MKLQDICEGIIARHRYPIIMGNDFILKLIKNIAEKDLFSDDLLGEIDLNPFNEMAGSLHQDTFPMIHEPFTEPLITEPQIYCDNSNFDIVVENTIAGWPATFADIMTSVS